MLQSSRGLYNVKWKLKKHFKYVQEKFSNPQIGENYVRVNFH